MPERPVNPLSVFRATLGLVLIAVSFPLADLVLRFGVASWIRLKPASRPRILARWMQLMASTALGLVRISGAKLAVPPSIPCEPGVLILMNHQSLFDIPIATQTVRPGYPLFVTRERYARGIPLISEMLRRYEHPLVRPGNGSPELLQRLKDIARSAPQPIVIFPEGGRTRDGQIRPFRTGGLRLILAQRPWQVYLLVADGMWRCARLKDFVKYASSVHTRLSCLGPFEAPAPGQDTDAFIDEMRERMCNHLKEIRGPLEPAAAG